MLLQGLMKKASSALCHWRVLRAQLLLSRVGITGAWLHGGSAVSVCGIRAVIMHGGNIPISMHSVPVACCLYCQLGIILFLSTLLVLRTHH